MQYELLSDRFADDADTNASALDLIKSMAGGTRANHAGALKFGLREGFSRIDPPPIKTIQPLSKPLSGKKPTARYP